MKEFDSWSEYYHHRKKVRNEFGPIWDIPIVKREIQLIAPLLPKSARVLEIGPSKSNRYLPGIKSACPDVVYKSMDVDRQTPQDFYSLDEITGEYDLVMSFEVVEHIPLNDVMKTLMKAHSVTAPGGSIILSTPNLHHPHRYWDSTHITPLRFEEIGALLLMAGYGGLRIYRKHTEHIVKKILRRTLFMPFHRMLDVDFANTIIATARKLPA